MEARYQKNIDDIFSEQLQEQLLTKTIAVIGCGGAGGYILEFLIRLGVKEIIFWDGDIFSESNLNRQLGCTLSTLGQNKALVLKDRMADINSNTILHCCDWYFGDRPIDSIVLSKVDIVINVADIYYNAKEKRKILREVICKGIPVIEGAGIRLGGYVRIYTINSIKLFDDYTDEILKVLNTNNIIISSTGCPAYKMALVAAEMINQLVQYFSNSRFANIDSTLYFDIYHHKYNQFDIFGEF